MFPVFVKLNRQAKIKADIDIISLNMLYGKFYLDYKTFQ